MISSIVPAALFVFVPPSGSMASINVSKKMIEVDGEFQVFQHAYYLLSCSFLFVLAALSWRETGIKQADNCGLFAETTKQLLKTGNVVILSWKSPIYCIRELLGY